MAYLKTHLPQKTDPRNWLPQAHSAIVIALNYVPHPKPAESPLKHLKIARYARGEDYHFFLKRALTSLVEKLKLEFDGEYFGVHTDSSPIMERDLGYQAQLGWFGKNSCLIHPKKGSFFLIGEILTSMTLTSTESPLPDFCGTCSRCIDQCPTQAIRPDRTLEANKCISYLNNELKGLPEVSMIPKMKDWFFGCDICQEVCPWNKKVFGAELTDKEPTRDEILKELHYILASSNKQLERDFKFSPLLRRRAFGLKRNALVLAANIQAKELQNEIQAVAISSEKLKPLADYVLESFNLRHEDQGR